EEEGDFLMSARKQTITFLLLLGLVLLLPQAASAATPSPAWSIQPLAEPTNFKPGEQGGADVYEVFVTNTGGKETDGSNITITDALPKGIGVKTLELEVVSHQVSSEPFAAPKAVAAEAFESLPPADEVTIVTCTVKESLPVFTEPATLFPQETMRLSINTEVPPSASGALVNRVRVEGGGAATETAEGENEAGSKEAPAGFQEFHSRLLGADGRPVSQADSHLYAYVTEFGFNTELPPPGSTVPVRPSEGDVRHIEVVLPPGMVGNPTAVQRCTAQQFN